MRRWVCAFVLFVAACPSRRGSRCERVCAREKECAGQLRLEHDQSECVEACTALDRDPVARAEVDKHVKCVDEAASCRAVTECD